MAINLFKTWGLLLSAMAAMASPIVVESIDETPAGWEEVSSPAPHKLIKLSIGLESEDHHLLERTLSEVSDPDHPNYGKHLSREEAKALLNPPRAASDSVKRWLSDAGVPENHIRDDGQWLHVRTTVGQAEDLLSTRFGIFARDDDHIVRTRQYSVPAEIRDHIAMIQPTTFFHRIKTTGNTKPAAPDRKRGHGNGGGGGSGSGNIGNYGGPGPIDEAKCKDEVTPACLRKLYRMPLREYPTAHRKSLYGIAGFSGQTAQYDQLEEFLRRFAPDLEGASFSEDLVNGGTNNQGDQYPSGEANLNIQWAVALAHQVPVRFISVGGENHDFNVDLDLPSTVDNHTEPYLEFTTHLLNLPCKDLPQVISISYGVNEQHMPKPYARQVCNMFGLLGARGVSVVVGAGNLGPGASCVSNDGTNTQKFLPGFPAACPYVTSVGGTDDYSAEVASMYASGGFSEYFSRPWWQDQAVKKYLEKHGDEWTGYYNPKGRAYPDVAALDWGYQIMNHYRQETTGGTSAASPVFGSMVALLNNERFKKGKPPMGFLNPWLYKFGRDGFTDITVGKSAGCQGRTVTNQPAPSIPNAGWKAAKGWDPVTGLGTPRFDKLRRLAT
ncbi:hypothetical protein ACJ41O_005370 [Fusarium nematophilum]